MVKNQLKIGSILSYLQIALSVIIGILYTPIMIRLLGQNEYGLYQMVASTISMLSILSLGFNSSYIRYFAKYKKENNNEAIYKLNGLFLIIFFVIGIVALLCGLFLTNNLNMVFDEGLTTDEYKTAKVLMLLMTINLAVSFPMSVFQNIISANEKFVFLKLLGMLKTVASPLVTLPLLYAGFRSITMVVVSLCIAIFTDACYFIYVVLVLKQKFVFHDFEKGLFKDLFVYTSFIAINLIIDQINWNVDKFLLGRFKGTASVAVYSVGYLLYNYYMMFSIAISDVFTPRIHGIINETKDNIEEQRKRITDLFVKVGRIQFLILSLLATGLIFFGKPFIALWAGGGYEESYNVTLLLTLPATIALMQNVGIEIQRAQNKHKFRSIVYLLMAIANLIISIFACQKWGPTGAASGTAISLIVANGLIMNIYYHKKCNINILAFWKNILRMCLGLIIPCFTGILIMQYMDFSRTYMLFVGIGIYTVIYAISMWLLSMNKYERSLVLKPIKRVIRK